MVLKILMACFQISFMAAFAYLLFHELKDIRERIKKAFDDSTDYTSRREELIRTYFNAQIDNVIGVVAENDETRADDKSQMVEEIQGLWAECERLRGEINEIKETTLPEYLDRADTVSKQIKAWDESLDNVMRYDPYEAIKKSGE